MLDRRTVYFVGYASGIAGSDSGSGDGPEKLKNSPILAELNQKGVAANWVNIIQSDERNLPKLDVVSRQCTFLANEVSQLVNQHKFFMVFGGDHSCAIGTWSGVYNTLADDEELGLIWIDAHMDSHTPDTSLTGNIHGMPLASLLGYGDSKLINIMKAEPKLKPENICLIGTRSYEEGEAALLQKLNVQIFYMDDVKKQGMEAVMQQALTIVKRNTKCFGVTLDIDAIDPIDAPATGVVESDGIRITDVYQALHMLKNEKNLIGVEIAEFDPHKDIEHRTEKVITNLVSSITLGKVHD